MSTTEIPIIRKTYECYATFHSLTKLISKNDRYTVWQKCQITCLEILEQFIRIGYTAPTARHAMLITASVRLDILKLLVRLCFESKTIDKKAYLQIQKILDEIGRMLGGWLKSFKSDAK